MSSEKITLPSLRNIEWRIVKAETNKVNHVLAYISTNNITELNELIYAGEKLVGKKIGIPSKSTKEKSKPGWEFQQETQIKKSAKTDKNDKTKERRWNNSEQKRKDNTGKTYNTSWGNKPESTGEIRKINEISTKSKTIDKTGHSKTMKENSINNWEEITIKHTNNQMQKKPNDFGPKYGNQKT